MSDAEIRDQVVQELLAIAPEIDEGDLSPFTELMQVLSQPYEDRPEFADYAKPPETSERVYRTFCGT